MSHNTLYTDSNAQCKPYHSIYCQHEEKQGQRKAWCIPSPKYLTWWPWPLTYDLENPLKDVDSRVFTRMLCGKTFDPVTLKIKTLLRTKYVPSLVKIHWRMLILECSQGCYVVKNLTWWPWSLTLKINRVPDSLKD